MEDKKLFNEGNYRGLINKYQGKKEDELDVWQLYWICKSYYKLKEYAKFQLMYKKYISKKPEKDLLRNFNLWSYFHSVINVKEVEERNFFKCAEYIISNCEQEDEFSPYTATVLKVIKHIKATSVNLNYENIYNWTGYLNPNLISDKEKVLTDENGKETKYASDKEQWYCDRSKACLRLEKYEECIKVCEEGLGKSNQFTNNIKFHGQNEIWLKSRIGKCKRMIGDLEEAKKIFSRLVLESDNFSLKSELAEIYEELNEEELSKRYYYEAVLSNGAIKSKINIIEKIGDILIEDGNLQSGKLHYLFVKSIREEENWKISNELINKINILENVECTIDEKQLQRKCKEIWSKELKRMLPVGNGVIKNLLKGGNSGFIKAENRELYFNTRNILGRKTDELIGKKVDFSIIESYDRNKKTISFEAINIRLS